MNLRKLLPAFFAGKSGKISPEGKMPSGSGNTAKDATASESGKSVRPATAPAAAHLRLGSAGEDAAAELLTGAGCTLLARNWRQARLELDMVCLDGDTIVFVEVKTRSSERYGGPAYAVGLSKQRVLCRAAHAWLAAHEAWDKPCRFDVICVLRNGDTLHLEHFRHAFDCPPALDSSHTSWQPW